MNGAHGATRRIPPSLRDALTIVFKRRAGACAVAAVVAIATGTLVVRAAALRQPRPSPLPPAAPAHVAAPAAVTAPANAERDRAEAQRRLVEAEQAVRAFQAEHALFQPAEQVRLLLERRAALEAARAETELQLRELLARARMLERRGASEPDRAGLERTLLDLRASRTAQKARADGLTLHLAAADAELRALDGRMRELDRLQRKVEDAARAARTPPAPLPAAARPEVVAGSRAAEARWLLGRELLLGLALALASGLAYAFAAEALDQRLSTPERARRRLQLPVLATTAPAGAALVRLAPEVRTDAASAGDDPRGDGALEREMLLLHERLESTLPVGSGRIVQFASVAADDEASSITRSFAEVVSSRTGKSVLVLHGREGERAGATPALQVPAAFTLPAASDGASLERLLGQLRQRIDLVLVDSVGTSEPDSLAVARRVDGVVLVADAESTRWPVAVRAREAIERGGGTVLGVVLGNCKRHIPQAVYRRL